MISDIARLRKETKVLKNKYNNIQTETNKLQKTVKRLNRIKEDQKEYERLFKKIDSLVEKNYGIQAEIGGVNIKRGGQTCVIH